jgi:hypothetical protein
VYRPEHRSPREPYDRRDPRPAHGPLPATHTTEET